MAESARVLGALALLGVGAVHLQQYADDSYNLLPTIGTLFLLNFVAATIVGLALLAPVRRWAGDLAGVVLAALAAAAAAIAGGSLAALLVSEHRGLFGFMERGYREAIVVSMVLEVATVVLMAVFLAGQARRGRVAPAL